MITLNLNEEDCRNAAELIELYLPLALKDFYEAGELDNIDYLRSMLAVYDELKRAAKMEDDNENLYNGGRPHLGRSG